MTNHENWTAMPPFNGTNPDHTPAPPIGTATTDTGPDEALLAALNALLAAAAAADQEADAQADTECKVMYAEPDMQECTDCELRRLSNVRAGWFWCRRLGTWGKRYGCPVPKGLPPSPAGHESLVVAMATTGLGGTGPSADAERCGDMFARRPSIWDMARPVTGNPAAAAVTPACQVAGV